MLCIHTFETNNALRIGVSGWVSYVLQHKCILRINSNWPEEANTPPPPSNRSEGQDHNFDFYQGNTQNNVNILVPISTESFCVFIRKGLSPDVILCGRLGSKHQLTNYKKGSDQKGEETGMNI